MGVRNANFEGIGRLEMEELSMQRLTEEQMRQMENGAKCVVPPLHPIRDAWLRVLDIAVRVVTLGNGSVVPSERRGPVHWDGIVR